jgi:type I restriction enzyme R subunit
MGTEADTCRKFVLPKLYAAGWTDDQIREQRTFTDGRIVVIENIVHRRKQKRADYLLTMGRNWPIAVVEAKPTYKKAGDGLQQAMDYAQTLRLNFAYSTNGKAIIEHDFISGKQRELTAFPSPKELWERQKTREKIPDGIKETLLKPFSTVPGKPPRYYQELAVNLALKAILEGRKRVLLTLATGTGKTLIAFQIVHRLWEHHWNLRGDHNRPRVLYLSDRNVLVDDPKDKDFAVLGDARHKIKGRALKSREVYFATYQAIAEDANRPGLFRKYPPDFFDLIIVDECHRGSAKDESNWRVILEYFQPAAQLGMTATPKRDDNADTYHYFGNPVYTYSLKQGIEDGFLAPYKVHRVITTVDATGYTPEKGQKDDFGRPIPEGTYSTRDFEHTISLRSRTEAVARHLTDHLKATDRHGKTIVFCVDQEHADQMRQALVNLNPDLVREKPDYVVRIVSEEGETGRGHLDRFMDVESATPVIATTSKLLTTGVDIPTCKNIALFSVINSMTEFKQIIGRESRVRGDYGKFYFTILDYTGSATRLFADPDFDGEPALIEETELDEQGREKKRTVTDRPILTDEDVEGDGGFTGGDTDDQPRKFYVSGVAVEILADVVYMLDKDGNRLKPVKFTDYTGEQVRTMAPSAAVLRSKWTDVEERSRIIDLLEERGISFDALARVTGRPEADPFDLLCNIAFNAPLRTRRERAELLKRQKPDFFERYTPEARQVLDELLEKYAEHGDAQFSIPDILKVPPLSVHGNVMEIAKLFGGPEKLKEAVAKLQSLIYVA